MIASAKIVFNQALPPPAPEWDVATGSSSTGSGIAWATANDAGAVSFGFPWREQYSYSQVGGWTFPTCQIDEMQVNNATTSTGLPSVTVNILVLTGAWGGGSWITVASHPLTWFPFGTPIAVSLGQNYVCSGVGLQVIVGSGPLYFGGTVHFTNIAYHKIGD